MKIYQIVNQTYYDRYSKPTHSIYNIRYKKRLLFGLIEFWTYVQHGEADMSGSYKTRTDFGTEQEARDFINNVLCKDKPRTETVLTPISEYTCK